MREPMLIVHLISVAAFLGASLSVFILNKVANKQEESLKVGIKKAAISLSYLGKTGLTLLIITGGYLMTPYWKALGVMPLLTAKLALVVVLLIVLVLMSMKIKKVKKEPTEKNLSVFATLNNVNLLLGIVIVVLAVLVFG